ncbi:nucleotide-diphospho-sugar transferase [Xylaria nigripes]|nr:nucleotide-diphospho-sugar transferase [Xylaria nigripes]
MDEQGGAGEDVYATLLLTDTYLPGALVLAHSLRDAGTTKKLAVLVTLDSVSAEAITELKSVYHYVIPVPRVRNAQPANLELMNRTDLHSAFTKINLWKQTQFRKIVYVDADVVAYRAPDELFNISHPFSAAPDIGWPDLFNTGVMVLTPNMGDYHAMMAMAEKGVSFDGADQGLINMHFGSSFNRISFTYNVTPSAHYQYIPAYRYHESNISMVHFIGSEKPWFQGRSGTTESRPFDQMIGRWWAVFDRYYRAPSPHSMTSNGTQQSRPISELVLYLTKGEYHPRSLHEDPRSNGYELQDYHQLHNTANYAAPWSDATTQPFETPGSVPNDTAPSRFENKMLSFQYSTPIWDAQRHPPPTGSKPEAINFPATKYQMSESPAPFVAPQRYPSPPKTLSYNVPKEARASLSEPLKPLFPWEANRPKPSRFFRDYQPHLTSVPQDRHEGVRSGELGPSAEVQPSSVENMSEPTTPKTPTIQVTPSDPWTSYSRTNVWDEVPEIERYVDSIQKRRRPKSLKSPGPIRVPSPGESIDVPWQWRGKKVTDFPSAVERPSLPVTPAPIRRQNFSGGGPFDINEEDSNPLLPSAIESSSQSVWLEKLARQQTEDL